MSKDDRWEYFNWPEILREAKLRVEEASGNPSLLLKHPERGTLEYWCAHVAHANLADCLDAMGFIASKDY